MPQEIKAWSLPQVNCVNAVAWFSAVILILAWWVGRRRKTKILFPEINRESLADEAEALSRNISALYGEYAGRMAVAWQADTERTISSKGVLFSREQSTDIRARLMERYGEKYNAEVWRIISVAQKCLSLDRNDVWRVSHGINDHDIQAVIVLLSSIATRLRYPQPDIPFSNKIIETKQAIRDAQRVGPRTTSKEKMGPEWNGGRLFQHPDPAHPCEFSGQPQMRVLQVCRNVATRAIPT